MPLSASEVAEQVKATLGEAVVQLDVPLGQPTLVIAAAGWLTAAEQLRDQLKFEQLVDLCGIDYRGFGGNSGEDRAAGRRFAVVYHLLSVSRNARLRVRVFAEDDALPSVDSVTGIWPVANWFEREAFDLFGIVFPGHPDLRRILTDYGFIGHPFRKDFPVSGHVEMRYDPEQQRVVYQPVSIEPREIVPRVVREEHYGDVE
jgi:NADH-quinone oxidoreductase subunit C